MEDAIKINCATCDEATESDKARPIFYTFLRANGALVADVIERVLVFPDASKLAGDNICNTCYQLLEELSGLELKYDELKKALWILHNNTLKKRDLDVTNFIRGVEIQTDPIQETELDIKQAPEEDSKKGILGIDIIIPDDSIQDDGDENVTIDADPPWHPDTDSDTEILAKKKVSLRSKAAKNYMEEGEVENIKTSNKKPGESDIIEGIGMSDTTRECALCYEKYTGYCELKKHMQHGHPSMKLKYKCRECEKVLTTHGGSLYHGRIHNVFLEDKDLANVFDFIVTAATFIPLKKSKYRSHYHSKKLKGREESAKAIPQEVSVISVSSSDDDDVPLAAKRRKQFIFNKIHQEVMTKKHEERKTNAKKALAELKKINGIEIRKVSSNPVGRPRKNQQPGKVRSKDGIDMMAEIKKLQDQIDMQVGQVKEKRPAKRKSDSRLEEMNRLKALVMRMPSRSTLSGTQAPDMKVDYPQDSDPDMLLEIMKIHEQIDQEVTGKGESFQRLPVIREPKFKCEHCDKMWKTKGELNSHKATHSDVRPFMCDICGQAYKHKNALDVHVGMHNGVFQHQCPYCKKAFTQKGALQRHLPIHTGDKPFQCELCGKQFVHRTSFSIHTMAHTGVRNIRCHICNLGVLSKSHLRRHLRIHTGEKPYECRSCGKTFAERYNLAAHQRTHDPTLPPARTPKKKQHVCRLCNVFFTTKSKLDEHMVQDHNKVADDQSSSRPGAFETADSFQAPRFTANDSESSRGDSVKSEDRKFSPEELLARRNFQALRNIDLMRAASIDGQLVRISAGMMDPPHGWSYLNH